MSSVTDKSPGAGKGTATEKEARQVAEAAREKEWTRPSFGKESFLGRFRLDLINPHPVASDEDRRKGEAFLAKLEKFLREEVDPLQIERDAKIPEHVVKGLSELGALGMKVDEKYGGLGLSNLYYNRALQLAGSAHSALSTLLSAHQSIGVPQPLKLFGTEEQKKKFLPRVATNEVSAFLLTEPDVGSDPARTGSTAVPSRGWLRVRDQRDEALDDERGHRRSPRRHGGRAQIGGTPRRHHRIRRRSAQQGNHRSAPQPVHGFAGH